MGRILIVLLGFVVALPVSAEKLKGGYPACISEESFDEFTNALVNEDERGMRYLVDNNRCIITKSGIDISVLDRGWGVSKVRAYVGDQAIVLWTNSENIVD